MIAVLICTLFIMYFRQMEKIWPGIQHIFPGKIPGIEKVISTLYVTENPKPTTKKNFFIVDLKTCRVI